VGEHRYQISGSDETPAIRLVKENENYRAMINGREYLISAAYLTEGQLYLTIDGRQKTIPIAGIGRVIFVAADGWTYQLEKVEDPRSAGRRSDRVNYRSGRRRPVEGAASSIVEASMPGIVQAVLVAEGEAVHKNQPLILLEAMKMELRLTAPHDGVVQTIQVQAGQLVQQGEILIRLA
jgi:3-methylcrotonyl-CoA carboxylase alpha subunit